MIKDVIAITSLAVFGTIVLSLAMGIFMWYLPWVWCAPVFLLVLVIGALFVVNLEGILRGFGYKFQEDK